MRYMNHKQMRAEIQAMQLYDCLRWRMPEGVQHRVVRSTVYDCQRRAGIVVRTLGYKGTLYMIRVE